MLAKQFRPDDVTDGSSHTSPRDASPVQPASGEESRLHGGLGAETAHELANLMMIVSGSLEQLRRQPLNKQGQQQLARAEWGARHAAQLTRQVLSRAQGRDGAAEAVDLNMVVGSFATVIGQSIDVRAQLMAELAPGRLMVRLDAKLLELVLLNLVRNAADAMPDGGEVVMRTRGPQLDGLGDQLTTEVSVSDNGVGMPPDVAQHATDAFFTTKPSGEGTGLELWMAHRFASASGGKVGIETAPGQGTTVRLVFPSAVEVEQG